MKPLLFLFCAILFVTAAHAQDADRAALIAQLQKLKKAVLEGDKQTVAGFFRFPVTSEKLKSKIEWSGQPLVKIKTLDRKQFIQYYSRIISPELVALFRHAAFEKLHDQQEWVEEVVPKSKKDFCYRTYEVIIIGNRVELAFYSNTRHDIQLTDDDYCEEYAEFWQFEWKNGQLQFRSMEIAG